MSEIAAVTDLYRKFMYRIITGSYKFCDVHLLCSLICIAYHAARWMLTGANVYHGSSARRARRILFIIFLKLTYL